MECAPIEHVAILGAYILLMLLCCSDRDQRVHVSIVILVLLVAGVAMILLVRQSRPNLVVEGYTEPVMTQTDEHHYMPPTFHQRNGDEYNARRGVGRASVARVPLAPVGPGTTYRRGYAMLGR